MKENREVTDTNVEDIEEALEKLSTGKKIKLDKLLRTFKREGIENFVTTRKKYVDVILSDYKRLLKENKELKQDRNNNHQMIALAKNEMLGYMQGYEDGKKLNKTATARIVENQQYYILNKQIEYYKEYIEKLQKENKELKLYNNSITSQLEQMTTEKAQKILDELQGVRPEKLTGEAKKLFEAIMRIADDRDKLKQEFDAVDNECSRLEQKEIKLEKENKQLKQRLKEQVLIVRYDTIKMYEENEIKLESRITELENVIIQALDELKNINFYESRLKNKNQKEVNKAYSMLFDALKTKER